MRFVLVVATLLVAVSGRAASAQDLFIGDPVMVEFSGERLRRLDGTLTAITADSIFVERHHRRDLRIARGEVRKLYVARNDGDMSLAGALLGIPTGVVVGGFGGAALGGRHVAGQVLGATVGAFAGGIIGLLAGDAIGSRDKLVTWIEAPWTTEPRTR